MKNRFLATAALIGILAMSIFPAYGKESSGVQMLPPTQVGTTTPCAAQSNSLLAMIEPGSPGTNQSAINCVTGSTLTGTGNLTTNGSINLLNGNLGQAIFVNGAEALWSNGQTYSWGYGLANNFFARPIGIAAMPTGNNQLYVAGNAQATGSIQVGNNTAACNGSNAGSIRFNPANLTFEGCNGTSWQAIGGSGGLTVVVGGCQTYWSSCPAGYTATSYFSPGTYNCCDKCGNPSWRYTVCSQ